MKTFLKNLAKRAILVGSGLYAVQLGVLGPDSMQEVLGVPAPAELTELERKYLRAYIWYSGKVLPLHLKGMGILHQVLGTPGGEEFQSLVSVEVFRQHARAKEALG